LTGYFSSRRTPSRL